MTQANDAPAPGGAAIAAFPRKVIHNQLKNLKSPAFCLRPRLWKTMLLKPLASGKNSGHNSKAATAYQSARPFGLTS